MTGVVPGLTVFLLLGDMALLGVTSFILCGGRHSGLGQMLKQVQHDSRHSGLDPESVQCGGGQTLKQVQGDGSSLV